MTEQTLFLSYLPLIIQKFLNILSLSQVITSSGTQEMYLSGHINNVNSERW